MVPVVVISKALSQQPYVPTILKCASERNSKVVFIGEEENKHYANSYEFVNLNDYRDSFQEYEDKYVHYNTTSRQIEMACGSRFFILRDWMKENNFSQALLLDTDVLLFANASEEGERYKYLDCAISGRTSGHSSYWSLEGITKFCSFLLGAYRDTNSFVFDKQVAKFNCMKKHRKDGGICDMTFIEDYARHEAPHLVGELSILSSAPYYDHHIGVDEGFETESGRKKFYFINGIPHAKFLKTGELVRFATIHCQGGAKKFIEEFYDLAVQS